MNFSSIERLPEWNARTCDSWFARSFAGLTLLHLTIILLSPLDLNPDETLYWAYAKHPDWSYYAKGPGIGAAMWLGSLCFGDTVLGVRSVALVSFSVFSAMIYWFLRSTVSPAAALFVFLLVRGTTMFAVTGFVATTDPLVLPFWLGSFIFAYRALEKDSPRYWLPSLFLAGLGVLVKYTAVLLPAAYGVILVFSRKHRSHLRSAGFISGCFAFLVAIVPVLIWNAQHEWVNLGHNVGHTVGTRKGILFRHLPELVLSQIGLVGPIALPLICAATFRAFKRWVRDRDDLQGLLAMSVIPLLVLSVFVSMTRACYPNWPLPAYVGGVLLLAPEIVHAVRWLWLRRAFALNAVVCLLLQLSWFSPLFTPESVKLPTPIRRMSGWTSLAQGIDGAARVLESSGRSAGRPFVYTYDYMTEASLRFYLPADYEVRLGSFEGRRLSEQDFWQTWPELIGTDAIVVGAGDRLPPGEVTKKWFASCEPLTVEGVPPPTRLAKPFAFLFCKGFSGELPNISRAF